jgi:hypothetical protein
MPFPSLNEREHRHVQIRRKSSTPQMDLVLHIRYAVGICVAIGIHNHMMWYRRDWIAAGNPSPCLQSLTLKVSDGLWSGSQRSVPLLPIHSDALSMHPNVFNLIDAIKELLNSQGRKEERKEIL